MFGTSELLLSSETLEAASRPRVAAVSCTVPSC